MVEFSHESADTKHQRNWRGNTSPLPYDVSFPAKLLPVYNRYEFVHVTSQVLSMEMCDGLQPHMGCAIEQISPDLRSIACKDKAKFLQPWFGQST